MSSPEPHQSQVEDAPKKEDEDAPMPQAPPLEDDAQPTFTPGLCFACGDKCNEASQMCGVCMRSQTCWYA